jgi:hypothetical protein
VQWSAKGSPAPTLSRNRRDDDPRARVQSQPVDCRALASGCPDSKVSALQSRSHLADARRLLHRSRGRQRRGPTRPPARRSGGSRPNGRGLRASVDHRQGRCWNLDGLRGARRLVRESLGARAAMLDLIRVARSESPRADVSARHSTGEEGTVGVRISLLALRVLSVVVVGAQRRFAVGLDRPR